MANSSDFTLDSYTTAVVLIPSQDIQDKVNALRKGNDKAYSRWMPHITFLFPFVAPEQLQHAVLHLTERIRESSLSPINVTLDHVSAYLKTQHLILSGI
jgi:2'-5' RNA ligase